MRRNWGSHLVGRLARVLALALGTLAACAPALAHKPSDSYLALAVEGRQLSGQWDIALRDLEHAIGLDADGNGEITWGELRAKHGDIAAYALARLAVSANGAACTLEATGHEVDKHTDGAYAVLRFAAECPSTPAAVEVRYALFFDLDPQHRGLARISAGGATRTAIFAPERATQVIELADPGALATLLEYGREGVWHIWIGFDHILFLLSLLLPSVLVLREGLAGRAWRPVPAPGDALWDVLRVVTAFTLAHSITLSAAALGWLALPSRLVESAIALSVVLAALNNLRPVVEGRRWVVAFGFGLIHGFGFASVLADLGLPSGSLLLALLGFNLGVEVGQLAIVAVFLPVAFALRGTRFYRSVVMAGGSVLIAVLAALWFAERAFNLKLLS